MVRKFGMVAIVAIFTVLPSLVSAQISPGTNLTGAIDRELDSKNTQVGQTFLLTNVHSSNHDVNGATVYGHVSQVQHAGQGTPGKIELAIDKINARSGNIYKVTGQVSNMKVNTKSNAGKEAGAAAAGALIGGLLGHTAGAVIGGTGGFLVAKNSRQNVVIPQGSLATVTISQARLVRRQSGHGGR